MSFYDQALAAEKASYLRLVETDVSSWSEADRSMHNDDLSKKLERITELEQKVASSSRRIHRPVVRVNI